MRKPVAVTFSTISVLLSVVVIGELSAQVVPPTPASADTAVSAEPPYSPRGAFFRSLVLPGWGQAYVGSPGRGAVYFTLAASSVWMSYVSRRQQADARAQQEWLRETGVLGPTDRTAIFASRAQQFEDWTTLSVFLFFFAGADAYVSAYLSDFDERIGIVPGADGSLQFRFAIPLHGPR